MRWLTKIFVCGKPHSPSKFPEAAFDPASRMMREATTVGETPCVSRYIESRPDADSDVVTVKVNKTPGERLGIRLFKNSMMVQSFEPDSAIYEYHADVPAGWSVCGVNGCVATEANVKQLLRACRDLGAVSIQFGSSYVPFDDHLPPAQRSKCSRASVAISTTTHSPTPSQLSSMWRRASETNSMHRQPSESGVIAIDFTKVSKDSQGMWTRRNTSVPLVSFDDFEYSGESPASSKHHPPTPRNNVSYQPNN